MEFISLRKSEKTEKKNEGPSKIQMAWAEFKSQSTHFNLSGVFSSRINCMNGLRGIKLLAGRDVQWFFVHVQLLTDKLLEIHRRSSFCHFCQPKKSYSQSPHHPRLMSVDVDHL
jgi:hypothetical protein